jgi:hypothetical protein
MKFIDPKELIDMYGPSFDGSGRLVNRKVTQGDRHAYERAGYQVGSIEEEPLPQPEEIKPTNKWRSPKPKN